jgi:hypothetical protein
MCSVKVNVKKNLSNYVTSIAHSKTSIIDSGCSTHYLKRGALCVNKQKSHIPIKVSLPNGATLLSSATADLLNANFNHRARSAHIIHGLAKHSLLSCGQICDAGYKVLFNQGDAIVIDGQVQVNGDIVMTGKRDHTTGLWTVPLDETAEMERDKKKGVANEINNVYEISKVHATIQYLHAAAGSPVLSTFVKAIEAGNFATWPTLTAQHVKKYLGKSEATVKGHLNQTRKNVRSTRPKERKTAGDTTKIEDKEFEPHITQRTNVIY